VLSIFFPNLWKTDEEDPNFQVYESENIRIVGGCTMLCCVLALYRITHQFMFPNVRNNTLFSLVEERK
jgi:hypothetical protein